FFNQYESGLALSNEDAPVISNNVVSTLSTCKGFKAMSLTNVSKNITLSNNIINAANGAYGIYLNDCTASENALGQISNNSIAVGGNAEAFGIYVAGATDNQIMNFNRVKLTVNGTPSANQAYYRNIGSGMNMN